MLVKLGAIIDLIYMVGIMRVPGLAILLPKDALTAMIAAIEVGFSRELQVDWKISDWQGFIELLKEVADAALTPTRKEQVEAIYTLLAYLTNIEESMSLEQFSEYTWNAAALLPYAGNTP